MFEKSLKPKWYLDSLYDININELKENGINVLFFDLDNTLIPYYEPFASPKTHKFINFLKANGFIIYVISNNHKKRVKPFAEDLEIKFLNSAYKPLTFRLKKLIKKEKLQRSAIALIGDQLLTDVIVAKRLRITPILVAPAVSGDLKKTKLNRYFDKKIRKKQEKKGYLIRFKERSFVDE